MAKILIVEDSRLIAHLAKTILAGQGHDSVLVMNGFEAVELAKSYGPDLILLDLILPGLDGYEVCRQIKKDPQTCEIAVIMLTSKSDPADKVRGLEIGAVDYITKPFDQAELIARVGIHLHIRDLYEALKEKNRQLQEKADRDGLTGLFNHRYFQEQISQEFARSLRYGHPLSCVMLDVDHFKQLNDTYGHQRGDDVLKEIGRLIADSVRESDLAARYGGEEFTLLLYHTDRQGAFETAERVRRGIEAHRFGVGSETIGVTVSAGAATFPHPQIHEAHELVECADKAMYLAKQTGRNRVELF